MTSSSTTITYVTPDHRYFMRRTKREIIDRIEQMTGQQFDAVERLRMMHMFKDELATLAMNAWRALPAPPDPVDGLIGVIIAELRRQSEADGPTPYARQHDGNQDRMTLDGVFDLRQLARAIVEGLPK